MSAGNSPYNKVADITVVTSVPLVLSQILRTSLFPTTTPCRNSAALVTSLPTTHVSRSYLRFATTTCRGLYLRRSGRRGLSGYDRPLGPGIRIGVIDDRAIDLAVCATPYEPLRSGMLSGSGHDVNT